MAGQTDDDLPASDDPIWGLWSAPILLQIIARPKGKPQSELREWAKHERLSVAKLINCLIWLENQGRIVRRREISKGTNQAVWAEYRPPPLALVPIQEVDDRCGQCGGLLLRGTCVMCGRLRSITHRAGLV